MTKTENNQQFKDLDKLQVKYKVVSSILSDVYGELEWQPGQSPMDELVSCILSQNTNDNNRDKAFDALKARYTSWQDVVNAPQDELIDTIRPAGLANQKGRSIQNALERIYEERGAYDIEFLRDMSIQDAKNWLTNLKGVGPKTAAIVLCFGFGLPAFPVDTHVHRTSKRIGFIPDKISADKAHPAMEVIVPPEDYYAFHIFLIRHGRDTCNARKPLCNQCPLTQHCDYYINVIQNDA